MWLPAVADTEWMTEVFSRNAVLLGLMDGVSSARMLDARLSHPHEPESRLCSGWATYELTTGETTSTVPILLYVKAFPAGASTAAWQQHCAAVPYTAARHLPTLDLIVWQFPEDPGLPALPALVDPVVAVRHLPPVLGTALAGSGFGPGGLGVEVVRYQPETNATLRYDVDLGAASDAPGVFAKHLAGGDVAATARRHCELWSLTARTPGLRIAAPLAADLQRGVLWTRALAGQPMVSALQPERLRAAAYDVALVLASLHDCGVVVAEQVCVEDALTEARKKSDKLAWAHPPIARLVCELATAAQVWRAGVHIKTDRTLHGDFHVGQLIDEPDGAYLVDLDSMVRGPAEMDLAEFVVDLSLRDVPEPVVKEIVPLLLDEYESHAGRSLDPALLRTFADAEFVNRCYRHLRRHAPGWSTALEHDLAQHDKLASLLPT